MSIKATASTHKREPVFIFSQDALDTLSAPYMFALVGKFSRGRLKMEDLRKFFLSLDLKGVASTGFLDSRHVLIKLSNEVDFHRIWSRNIWYVFGLPMRVFKWSPAFHVDRESSVVPV